MADDHKTVRVTHAGWNVEDPDGATVETAPGKTEAKAAGRTLARKIAEEEGEPVVLEVTTYDGKLDSTKIYRPR